jgi:glycosyltransferase involved in cell wall biosynthesis
MNIQSPLITILITNFNKKEFIEDTIKSCKNQSYRNIEIIVVDNCSTDGSIKSISKFKKIKLLFNIKRISPALNQIKSIEMGALKAKGEIICLLDGDDLFKKNKVAKIVRTFKVDLNLKVICDVPSIYLSKKKIHNFHYSKNRLFQSHIWPNTFPTSCISLKKKYLLECINLFKKNKFPLLEIDFRICCLLSVYKDSFLILNENLTLYRQVNNGIMSEYKKFQKKWWIKRGQAFEFFKNLKKNSGQNFNYSLDFFITKIIIFLLSNFKFTFF